MMMMIMMMMITTCVSWTKGTWTPSHNLAKKRGSHVSWTSPSGSGVFLMGGEINQQTSELVKPDGSVEEGFALKYKTRYLKHNNLIKLDNT